jgi:holo-[acyl-carrier protein] synthase
MVSRAGTASPSESESTPPIPTVEQLENRLESSAGLVLAGPVGVDVVHIPTWQRYVELTGEPLLRATYQAGEVAFAAGRPDRLATRLAAKEAVLKVLGTGVRSVGLREVEVVSEPQGKPKVSLHGRAADRAVELGLETIEISLCHEGEYAFAVAAGQRARR